MLRFVVRVFAGVGVALGCVTAQAAPVELVIATVDNGHMIVMQKLSKDFEQRNPDVHLKWITMKEDALRQKVSADIVERSGQYDVVTIGMYEVPIWAKKGWLRAFAPDEAYDVGDLLPAMRKGLSYDGKLYAAPFYGESSMLMYRADLMRGAGIELPYQPTWEQIAQAAAKLNSPATGVHGICLRGKGGWGENMALVSTMVNTYGGQWFDMGWKPQIASEPWKKSVGFYIDLMKKYGPPDAWKNSFNENLELFQQGHCAMWVDATIAASFLADPQKSKVADKLGFTQAPTGITTRGASWLWAWTLAIPSATSKADAAQRFVNWATSRNYIELVAKTEGWPHIPTGTRTSTYKRASFTQSVNFAFHEAMAIALADPNNSTLPKSPYVGVQFASIPEFQQIGQLTGERISAALAGKMPLAEALTGAQQQAETQMKQAGYYK